MFRANTRQLALVLLVGAVVALAGCTGGQGPTTTANSTTATTTATATATATSAGTNGQVAGYQWSANESYTYVDGGNNTYRFAVESIEDGVVTINFTAVRGGMATTNTITGEQGRFFRSLEESDRSKFGFFAFVYDGRLAIAGHDLEVGNSWTVNDDGTTVNVKVTGKSTVQGLECYNVKTKSPEGTLDTCVRKDWPLALSMTATGNQGLTVEYTVTDWQRPS